MDFDAVAEASEDTGEEVAEEVNAEEGGELAEVDDVEVEETEEPRELDWSAKTTVKVDGEDKEVTLEELKKNYELRRSSHKRFEEAASLRKQLESREGELLQLANAFRDPKTLPHILRNLGHDAKSLIAELQADLDIPEEVRERQTFDRERAEFARTKKAFEDNLKQQKLSADSARYQEEFTSSFNAALETHGMSGNPRIISRMASLMEKAIDGGYEMTADEAATRAVEEVNGNTTTLLGSMTAEQLEKHLPPDVVKALRASQAAELKRPETAIDTPRKATRNRATAKTKVRVSDIDGSFWDS